jgi:hypothetical protein
MISKDICIKAVKSFRAKQGVEAADENIIATIHLMNTHGLDLHSAMDQSSRSANDHGVDAWFYDDKAKELIIYQSKLTESRAAAIRGLGDLDYARQWLEEVLINGTVTTVPENHCLFNLYTTLSNKKESVRKINFQLLSPFEKNEMEDLPEYDEFTKGLIKSKLNDFIRQAQSGKLATGLMQYNLESGLPEKIKTYPITKIPNARIDLRKNAYLDLAYISLYSLVELYRQRGNVLFDKNVRLSLKNNKEAKDRLVHPLEETLDKITKGELSPNIFPFYHIGVTIAASASTDEDNSLLNLEAPSIINGCQTITIAQEYLKHLEKTKNEEAIDRFKLIKVVAKVVVGTSNEELKEITNANNRQNPIENWQLFSNEPIHIEIEQTLKDCGIFYERQKGKFDSLMKNSDNAKFFLNTNGTFIKVVDLAQVIALAKKNMQWAAKPSDIFLNKQNHDKIFDRTIAKYTRDMVYCSNLQKCIKRGLNVYLDLPTHANSNAPTIFKKPIVRNHVSRLALIYFYQSPNKESLRADYSKGLLKIASTILVDEMQAFYMKVVSKIKNWYTSESKDLTIEVSQKSMESFFKILETELGIDPEDGQIPFGSNAINWKEYEE